MIKRFGALAIIAFAASPGFSSPSQAASGPDDKAQITALENQFAAAVRVRDVDAIMKVYEPDEGVFVFDLVPPRQYVGAAAYRKDWAGFIGGFKGKVSFTISDLSITTADTLAYSHSIQKIAGTDAKGKPFTNVVRVTDVYKKSAGKWLIVHEHVSVPVDPDTSKADMMSKP